MKKASDVLLQLVRDCRGLASVEAAFFAPIFVLGALAVFDLGLAGTKRMELDQALRAGAQLSMINVNDETQIKNAALAALGEQSAGSVMEDGICQPDASCVTVNYACECADGTTHACDSLCTAGDIPSAYLTIAASRRHEGLLFPDMNLNTQIMVQTR
jgi:Flp pilus assembly protein TadG